MRKIQFDESLVGTVVEDDFTISQFLGAGAMGSTYKARQQSLGRDVCLKFLALSSFSEAENVQRFKREARIIGCISGCRPFSADHPVAVMSNLAKYRRLQSSGG